jgi:transcriptional regulator with XRE-family HTH domain
MSETMTIPSGSSTGEPEPVVVRRNAVLVGVLGLGAAGVCLAYLGRALSGGSLLDWLAAAALGVVAVPYLSMFAGARSPLLVADETGVRIKLGGQWRGLLWEDMVRVDVHPRDGFLHDGRVVIEAGQDAPVDAGLVGVGRVVAEMNSRLYGAPMAVSFGFTASSSRDDLVAALSELAAGRVGVAEVGRAHVLMDDPGADSWAASSWGDLHFRTDHPAPTPAPADEIEPDPPAPAASPADEEPERLKPADLIRRPVLPARISRPALRAEITKESEPTPTVSLGALALTQPVSDAEAAHDLPEQTELRRSGTSNVSLIIEDDAGRPPTSEPADEAPTEDLPVADDEPLPDSSPDGPVVIGNLVADGRTALGLSVDELAARTRIRPHVIESVERDDFAPCGGDFYARGHLRTFARVLGIDETRLIDTYDAEYATEPISPRVVFEAELATGPAPTLRGSTGGPKWGAMIAVVLLVLMAWGVVRLVAGGHSGPGIDAPVVNGSGGIQSPGPAAGHIRHAKVRLKAAYGDSRVTARSAGDVLFTGKLTAGTTKVIRAKHAIQLTLSDGGAVLVTTNGTFRRTLGDPGERVTTTIRPHGGAGKSGQRSAR